MEIRIACATWIKEEDERVLDALRASDRWLTPEELTRETGLHPNRVKRTLSCLQRQMAMYRGRKRILYEA